MTMVLSGSINCARSLEKGSNPIWRTLQRSQMIDGVFLHLLLVIVGKPSQRVSFEAVPDKFVRVEFGAIAGEEKQLESPVGAVDEAFGHFGLVAWVPVDNEIDGLSSSVQEQFEKLHKLSRPHGSLHHHESKQASRAYGGYHVEPEASARAVHDWSQPLSAPSSAAVMVGTNTSLVAEEDFGPGLTGLL